MASDPPIRTNKPSAGLLGLPTEIISAICCSLCLHCQIDYVVEAPSDAVAAAHEDQKAISRLSRCSKRLCDIAQPVLFHWFQGLKEEKHIYHKRHVAFFVDTMIRNPKLRASVKALALYQPEFELEDGLSNSKASSRHPYAVDGIYHSTAKTLGRGHLERRALFSTTPGVVELQDLAVAISSGLSQLCIRRFYDHFDEKNYSWRSWSYDMPSLTYLALPGARKGDGADEDTYHIHEAKSLLRHASNLRTLVAPDCSGGYELEAAGVYKDDPWDVPLPHLRKLSLNGISVLGLERILHSCPVLEDLEYYDAPLLESW